MISPNTQRQPKSKIPVNPKSFPGKVTMMLGTVPLQDKIRQRAYELYESRVCELGQDKRDWFQAEQEILKQQR